MADLEFGGTLFFKAGATQYDLAASFKIDVGGKTRTGRSNIDGSSGFTTKNRLSMWEVELSDGANVSLATLQGLEGAIFTAELSNGKTYLLNNGWQEGELQVDVVEGKMTMKLAGPPSTELLGG